VEVQSSRRVRLSREEGIEKKLTSSMEMEAGCLDINGKACKDGMKDEV
jgi:hypothetical protein